MSQYKTHLEPNFVGINLPAYFGGITLQNKSIEQFDICEVLSYLKGDLMCTLYVCIFLRWKRLFSENNRNLIKHILTQTSLSVVLFVFVYFSECYFLKRFNPIFLWRGQSVWRDSLHPPSWDVLCNHRLLPAHGKGGVQLTADCRQAPEGVGAHAQADQLPDLRRRDPGPLLQCHAVSGGLRLPP